MVLVVKLAGKERGFVGGRRGVVCRVVPRLTYEQALVASEVDIAFHIEDKESWRQSLPPSLPLSLLLLSVCLCLLFYKSIERPRHVPTFLQCALKTIGRLKLACQLCMCVSNRCLVPVIDGSTSS